MHEKLESYLLLQQLAEHSEYTFIDCDFPYYICFFEGKIRILNLHEDKISFRCNKYYADKFKKIFNNLNYNYKIEDLRTITTKRGNIYQHYTFNIYMDCNQIIEFHNNFKDMVKQIE